MADRRRSILTAVRGSIETADGVAVVGCLAASLLMIGAIRLAGRNTASAPNRIAGTQWRSLVDRYWDEVDIYDGEQRFLKDFGRVPGPAGHLLAVQWCQSEVCNGGFLQFFGNSTGVLAPEAVAGFRAIGMTDAADVVQKAMDFFPRPYPRDRDDRIEFLGKRLEGHAADWDAFRSLDRQFYRVIQSPDGSYNGRLDAAANQFARAHAE